MMLTALILVSFGGLTDAPRAAHFITQAQYASTAPTAAPRTKEAIRQRIIELNREINGIETTGWGAGNVALAIVGFTLSSGILIGLVMVAAGVFDAALLIAGLVVTAVGILGLVLGIIASTNGTKNSFEAKEIKGALNKEKRQLTEQLQMMENDASDVPAPPPPPPPPPSAMRAPQPRLVTLAVF